MSTQFPLLFSPIEIGPRTIKERICCSAHAAALAQDGMPTDRTVRYYELKARGGARMIMGSGPATVDATSTARARNGIVLYTERVIPCTEHSRCTIPAYAT